MSGRAPQLTATNLRFARAAQVVNRPSHQFLARSRRPLNQHGAVARRDIGQDIQDASHLVVLADDVLERVLLVDLPAEQFDGGKVAKCFDAADGLPFLSRRIDVLMLTGTSLSCAVQDVNPLVHPPPAAFASCRARHSCVWQIFA